MPEPLTGAEAARYDRQIVLPAWGIAAQQAVRDARVAVVGAGGLGCPALTYLAAAGIGYVRIIDDDVVAESNLHRQVLYTSDDVGRPKADVAAERIGRQNPYVDVEVRPTRLTADTALDLLDGVDVVVDGSDNFATRYAVSDATVLLGIPLVWASVLGFDGQLSIFSPPAGPCYRCVFGEAPAPGQVPSCAEAGVIGVLPGQLGVAQAAEVLKIVTGVGTPMIGRVGVYDALAGTWGSVAVRRDPGCPSCGEQASIVRPQAVAEACAAPDPANDREITVDELAGWLAERNEGLRSFVLVDIREPHEWAINRIPGAEQIPMGRLLDGENPPGEGPWVLYCKAGIRSARVLAALTERGLDAYHVAGGVSAWVRDVDPSQSDY